MKQNPIFPTHGFSLVELSIVLVVLGLLTGGILTGQALIRTAELRSVVSDFQRYEGSVTTFKDKYFQLPGDMTNAIDFWGAADSGDGAGDDCVNATSTNGLTCNGDGNGLLMHTDSDPSGGYSTTNAPEWFHAWVQMSNAGLVNGTYTGRRVADHRQAVPGANVPASKISGAGFTLMSCTAACGPDWYPDDQDLMIFFGAMASGWETNSPALLAEEAWGIDKKLDDGRPGLGNIRTLTDNADCVTVTGAGNQMTAEYDLQTDSIACSLIYSLVPPS